MKKLRLKGLRENPNCAAAIQRCVQTADGLEEVHVDLATGEITYTPGTCCNEDLLRESLEKEGFGVEDVK